LWAPNEFRRSAVSNCEYMPPDESFDSSYEYEEPPPPPPPPVEEPPL
jgi:hypothetical protein